MTAPAASVVETPSGGLTEELLPAPSAWDVALRLADRPHLLFLDSALPGGDLGRYSFVTADPFAWIEGGLLAALDDVLRQHRIETLPGLPPFQGGAAGLFGYDLCHQIERLPRPRFDEFGVPPLAVGLYDCVVSFDHEAGRAWAVSTGLPERGAARTARARRRLRELRSRLERPAALPNWSPAVSVQPAAFHPLPGRPGVGSSFTPDGFRAAIARAIEYVHAGDCFQVNIAQRLLAPQQEHPLTLYDRLRRVNPAPFAGYLDLGPHAVASASPERFVKVDRGHVQARPIKGTRPRGTTPREDEARALDLLDSAKDRAENVMIVDLLRNDLGRVCAYGTVRVEALCRLESYRTVHHLVSEVVGTLAPGKGPIDLLRAAFPGGSVTGAPKVRAMEIIAELEPTARGPYCGSLGYVGFDGSMDTSILIRTFTAGGGWLQFPVGGGIVADSDTVSEYRETLTKAEGLLRAL